MNEPDLITETAVAIEEAKDGDKMPDLRTLIHANPTLRRLYLGAVVRCLGCRKFFFDKDEQAYRFEPDGSTVMKAAVFLASYDAGLPMQTTVNLNIGADKGPTLEEATSNSPALVEALEKALAKAKRPGRQVKRVEEV